MYKSLPKEEKIELIRRIKSGEKVSKVCKEVGISRTILYRWLKSGSYALYPKHPKGKTHWKKLGVKSENKIIKIALKNPGLAPSAISKIVKVSQHGVWNVLKRNGLNTREARSIYVHNNGSSLIRSLNVNDKITMMRRLEAGEKVSNICRDFKVSRTVFYRWLKRYSAMQNYEDQAKRGALESLRPKGSAHWRFVPGASDYVLQIVLEHPEYSAHKISSALSERAGKKLLGSHGVHNLLTRLNLTTYQRRLAYAKSQEAIITPVPQVQEGWRIPIFGKIPSVSALAPPGFFNKLISSKFFIPLVTIIFLGFIFSVVLSNLSYGQGIIGKIGILFSFVALFFGMFFFIYSLKYYITIAIVLSFSRRKEDGNRGDRGDKGAGLKSDLSHITLQRHPFVSIHIASYNEKRVIERLLKAVTSIQYSNFEVVVVDDSNDETTEIIKDFLSNLGEIASSPTAPRNDNSAFSLSSRGSDSDRGNLFSEEIHKVEGTKNTPSITLVHRKSREGFKGGALGGALRHTDKRAEFVMVLDADFIPYPDTITQFLKYFQSTAGTLDFRQDTKILRYEDIKGKDEGNHLISQYPNISISNIAAVQGYQWPSFAKATVGKHVQSGSNIAAIQGYQWHVLNKSENWITRGVRSEYAGSYVIERSGEEIYEGLKQISGSVYMIRREILETIGWGTSLTEDFELTLKLYELGYKVVYTPYIQAPAEAVSTIKRLVRQRMRWAEGHSHNIRKMFVRLMFGRWQTEPSLDNEGRFKIYDLGFKNENTKEDHKSYFINHKSKPERLWIQSKLTLPEKLEFLYLSPYYLQAAFFIFGTLSWFIAEVVFRVRLPFWTEVWGWSLVATNLLALPLMNMVGLFMEESSEKDYLGLFSFVILSYIVAPFQGYAAVKGFLAKEEGPWFRTPKTGRITDVFTPGRLYRFFAGIFGRPQPAAAQFLIPSYSNYSIPNTNDQLNQLAIRSNRSKAPARFRFLPRLVIALLLMVTVSLSSLPHVVPITEATNPTDTKWYLRDQDVGSSNDSVGGRRISCPSTTDCKIAYYDATNGDLKFIDCDDATCSLGTITLLDGNTGCTLTSCSTTANVGENISIDCPTASDCKISYYDVTNTALNFADCDTATCSSGTVTILDGRTGCVLTSCSTTGSVGLQNSIYCPTATDCKIAYRDVTNTALKMADCDSATCGSGTTTILDGASGCTLTNCSTTGDNGAYNSIYCPTATDCKIAYRDQGNTDLLMADCDSATCGSGTTTLLDGGTGCTLTNCSTLNNMAHFSIYCPTDGSPSQGEDCKIAYGDVTAFDLRMADCDSATCGSGTTTLLDGGTGCTLTNCSTTQSRRHWPSIQCLAAADCKISYWSSSTSGLYLADCDSATCGSGTTTILDGASGCTLTNCSTADDNGRYDANYCVTATDCKIVNYDNINNDLKFADCDSATCGSGTTLTLDGNKIINATLGAVTTTKAFGSAVDQTITMVSNVEYPSGDNDGSLGTGTYTLKLNFTNNIIEGTLTWHYHVGYCTISSNCGTKTVHVSSADQSFISSTSSPQSPTVTAGSSLTIPAPTKTKWIYVELHATALATTGTITINLNNTSANNADTNIDIPALTVPEKLLLFLPVALLLPQIIRVFKRRRIESYATAL